MQAHFGAEEVGEDQMTMTTNLPAILLAKIDVDSRLGMTSAIAEQEVVRLWDYTTDKDGTYWFWPSEHEEPGSMVHCGDSVTAGKKKSEGYAGRTMTFPTKDGPIDIQGPWHSNSKALYERTGVDIRDKHLTWGLVALKRTYQDNKTIFLDVIHIDAPGGVIGLFERISTLAQTFADELGRPVVSYSRSRGGSSNGPVYPTAWTREQQTEYWKDKTNGV